VYEKKVEKRKSKGLGTQQSSAREVGLRGGKREELTERLCIYRDGLSERVLLPIDTQKPMED
jgi:hypothetical protein